MISPPRLLVYLIRWFHQFNKWTVRRFSPVKPHKDFGWSALSWWGSIQNPPSQRLIKMRKFIDLFFGPNHCKNDYERIMAGQPLEPNWRECFAAIFIIASIVLLPSLFGYLLVSYVLHFYNG